MTDYRKHKHSSAKNKSHHRSANSAKPMNNGMPMHKGIPMHKGMPAQNGEPTFNRKSSRLMISPQKRYENSPKASDGTVFGSGVAPVNSIESPLSNEENLYLLAREEMDKTKRRELFLRKSTIVLLCLIVSIVLNLMTVHIPYTPSILSIDFSAFPELIICLTVNPLVAVVTVFVKNGIYYLLNPGALPSIPNKIVLNIAFIIITWCLSKLIIKNKRFERENEIRNYLDVRERDYTSLSVFLAGTISSVLTAFASVVSFKTVLLPVLFRWAGEKEKLSAALLNNYINAYKGLTSLLPFVGRVLPSIDSLSVGILVYNIPMVAVKYFCCTAVAALVLPPINNFVNKK